MGNRSGPAAGSPVAASHPVSARSARTSILILLLVLIVAGARSASSHVNGHGPLRSSGALIGIALELVLALLLLALRRVSERTPRVGYPAARLRVVLRRTITGMLLIVAGLVLASFVYPQIKGLVLEPVLAYPGLIKQRRFASTQVRHVFAGLTKAEVSYLVYGGLALVVIGAIAVLVILRRRRSKAAAQLPDVGPEYDPVAPLRQAVESGRAALRSSGDPKAAIIACYHAMELSLAAAGAVRSVAETADELLARAAGSGLVHGPDARRLTALFSEARFSSHALPPTAKAEASRALDAISAELTALDAALPQASHIGTGR